VEWKSGRRWQGEWAKGGGRQQQGALCSALLCSALLLLLARSFLSLSLSRSGRNADLGGATVEMRTEVGRRKDDRRTEWRRRLGEGLAGLGTNVGWSLDGWWTRIGREMDVCWREVGHSLERRGMGGCWECIWGLSKEWLKKEWLKGVVPPSLAVGTPALLGAPIYGA
jgi:hypothetical protein